MWDKLFGYVGLPMLVDLFNKFGVDTAAAHAVKELKHRIGNTYTTLKRQARIAAINPLLKVHIWAAIIHLVILIVSAFIVTKAPGEELSYLWLDLMAVSFIIHVWMFHGLPKPPKFKMEDGEFVVYDETIIIDGETIEHPFAGQRVFEDGHEIDLDRVSLTLSINMTLLAGFISSVALMLLCKSTGNLTFLLFSFIVAIPTAFSLEIFIGLLNWFLVRVVRIAEGSVSFLFTQAAILLPHITADNATKGIATNLIREEKFYPAYVRIRDQILSIYLLLAIALLLKPSPQTFDWIATVITLFGLAAIMMTRNGKGHIVIERNQRLWSFIFGPVAIIGAAQAFLRNFFPAQADKIASSISGMIIGLVNECTSPCNHLMTDKPWRSFILAAVIGAVAFKIYEAWKKERKEAGSKHKYFLLGSWIVVGLFSLSFIAGTMIAVTDSKVCSAEPVLGTIQADNGASSKQAPKSVSETATQQVASTQNETNANSTPPDSTKPVEPTVTTESSEKAPARVKQELATVTTRVVTQQAPQPPPSEPATVPAKVASTKGCRNCNADFAALEAELGN